MYKGNRTVEPGTTWNKPSWWSERELKTRDLQNSSPTSQPFGHDLERNHSLNNTKRDLKQPQRRRQQKPRKFTYLTMKNSIFARFARAYFIFWHFEDVLVLSTTWNDLFCSCVDDVSIWWQMFNFVFLCPKRCFQFNSRIVRTHFWSIMSLNNWKIFAETRSYISRWRSRFRRRRVCLSSLLIKYVHYRGILHTKVKSSELEVKIETNLSAISCIPIVNIFLPRLPNLLKKRAKNKTEDEEPNQLLLTMT